ncbi:type II toxin-antitoxin system HicA family toxin [Nocardiopsis mangrovi]|uniref:Type II toxin-antitoxin system HicA family toxin n=1 Tax=Nocardiopsis mangrovi TaxID=1179818 RepID=A0ABV9E0Z0_9ACTN
MPITVREIIKRVQHDGWYLERTCGSHRHFKHPTKKGVVTIPGQLGKTLPIGTERSILKQAGL